MSKPFISQNHFIPLILVAVLNNFYTQPAIAQINCANSTQDEMILEYFNLNIFNDLFSIIIDNTSSQFLLSLTCPQAEHPELPPSEFLLQLSTFDNSSIVSCNTGSISLSKADLAAKSLVGCDKETCEFMVTLSNSLTSTLYSKTLLDLTLTNENQTIFPTLELATLPICHNSALIPCLTHGTCQLSTSNTDEIKLCESATSCISSLYPSNHQPPYAYNSNIYFNHPNP